MSFRSLKIEVSGDYWNGNVRPKIRLAGRWLEEAGFKPGHRVRVNVSQPGLLVLEFEETATVSLDDSSKAKNAPF